MQSSAATVAEYLKELPPDRRAAINAVRAVIRENLSEGYEEGMQYGMIGYYIPHRIYPAGYHCDPKQPLPFVCLASQKNYLSLYMSCVDDSEGKPPGWFADAWAKAGKKLNMGKSCIRFKKADDLPLDVIAEVIRCFPVKTYIAYYESAIKTPGNLKSAAEKAEKPAASRRTSTKSPTRKRKSS